jgi:tRNA (mo5U34)-methyltransferase
MQGAGRTGQFKPEEYNHAIGEAKKALAAGRFAEARGLYSESASLFPQSLQALTGLGISLMECDAPEKAVESLEQAVRLSWYDPGLHALLGKALVMTGRNLPAARHLAIAKIYAGGELESWTEDLLRCIPGDKAQKALEEIKRLGLAMPFDERGRHTTAIAKGESVLDRAEEERRISSIGYWHHEFILPSGAKIPGRAGNMLLLGMLDLPESLEGKKVLDVAAWDGFVSFECEARGALSVTALDWLVWRDRNIGDHGFLTMRGILGSSVDQVLCDAYDLDSRRLGVFDVTIMCGLLYHLHDPLKAIQALAGVTGEVAYIGNTILDTGESESLMRFSPHEDNHYNDFTTWWVPNTRCMMEMVLASGFSRVEVASRTLDASTGHGYLVLRAYPPRQSFRDYYLKEHPFILEEDWPRHEPEELDLVHWSTNDQPQEDAQWLDAEHPVLDAIGPGTIKAAFFNLRNRKRNELGIRLVKTWLSRRSNYELEGIVALYGGAPQATGSCSRGRRPRTAPRCS